MHYPAQKIILDLCVALKDSGWLFVETFGAMGEWKRIAEAEVR
jgi:hypothetical protein